MPGGDINIDPAIVSLVIALAALCLSASSLWLSALRPAEVVVEHLPEHLRVDQGGVNEIPSLYGLLFAVSLSNLGARAGLLNSVRITSVSSPGAPEFATGASGPKYSANTGTPNVLEDGQEFGFPRTIEAGEVRALRVNLELEGAFRAEAATRYLEAPPGREPLAEMVRDLSSVDLEVECRYRRGVGLFGRKDKVVTYPISIGGDHFRVPAVEHWRENCPDLAALVEGKPYSPADSVGED